MTRLLSIVLFLCTAVPVLAHGTSTHSKQMSVDNQIDVGVNSVQIVHIQRYHEAIARDLWVAADRDGDGQLSDAEWAQAIEDSRAVYLQWCRFDVDWKPYPPRTMDVELVSFPRKKPASFDLPLELVVRYRVTYDLAPGNSPLRMMVFNCTSLNAFSVNSAVTASGVVIENSSIGSVTPGGAAVTGAVQENGVPDVLSLVARLPEGTAPTAQKANLVTQRLGTQQAREQETLQRGLMARRFSFGSLALLFLSALGLGMLHAFSPGHGKTMVAAYMMASRGRPIDAVILGGVVTATHVSVVLLLGVGALVASQYVLPERIAPVLEVVSGLLVLASGFWLILSRAIALGRGGEDHDHHHGPGGHTHVPEWVMEKLARQKEAECGAAGFTNDYDLPAPRVVPTGYDAAGHGHSPDHGHDHGDGHVHPHGGGHVHDHGDGHGHSHGQTQGPGLVERFFAPYVESDEVGLAQLLLLGVSGGIVPCPTALVVLLVAVAIHRIALGLCLIVAFSIGLAAVLIGIGVAFATASPLVRSRRDSPLVRYVPLASAFVVLALGVYMTVKALIDNGWIILRV